MESQIPHSTPAFDKIALDYDKYPQAVSDFLRQNRADSELFVREAEARQRWLHDHSFRVSADLCIDGRVSDFSEALGLPTGLLEMHRSGGAKDSVGSWRYARLTQDGNRKLRQLPVGGICIKQMAEMRFCVVHYSESRPKDASCAAWKHDTQTAALALRRHAGILNESFRGHLVAMVALVDTDLDAVTLIGPRGRLCTTEFARLPDGTDMELKAMIKNRLREIFPEDWDQIASLTAPPFIEAFYDELAEHLLANVSFVRRVIRSERPIELLDHQERLIFVGRPLETRIHNAALLIGDTDNLLFFRRKDRLEEILAALREEGMRCDVTGVISELEAQSDFGIALRIVLGNVVHDALKRGDRDFKAPILISVPHDADDKVLTAHYARGLRSVLQSSVGRLKAALTKRTLETVNRGSAALLAKGGAPDWLKTELERLEEHVTFCTTVHDRRTRLFIPCD